jgi:hypothetical protein
MLHSLNAVVEQWVTQWGYLGIFAAGSNNSLNKSFHVIVINNHFVLVDHPVVALLQSRNPSG